jgi:S-methylmethionine-dependent homocysteine/selenocysteine methylase
VAGYQELQQRIDRGEVIVLMDAGVDFLLMESTGTLEHRKWVSRACTLPDVPKWMGFKCHVDTGDPVVKVGYRTDVPLARALDEVIPLGGSVLSIFHSSVDDTDAALPLVKDKWTGLGIYPEASRGDYTATWRDASVENAMTPKEFLARAQRWVEQGVQVIGGCCGIGVEYIRPLRQALPPPIASPRGRRG